MPLARRRRALAACLALAVVVLTGCDPAVSPPPSASPTATATPSPTPSGAASSPASPAATGDPSPDAEAEAIYGDIEAGVVRVRELEPRAEVDPQLLTEDELKVRLERSFREGNPEDVIEASDILYHALGMLDDDESLAELYLELLGSQVLGFYDWEAKELVVVARSGGLGVNERVTYAHEFTHALQDQHFGIDNLGLDEQGQGDRNAGRLALLEGDATAAMVFWAQTALSPEEVLELLEDSQTPEQREVLERMPPVLRETLIFPYERGLQLVLGLQGEGGWDAVNEAFADPPASTEQVLHPEKYAQREAPVEVALPRDLASRMGAGWRASFEDTFGEFQFQVWLRNALDADTGNPAAAGWGGDRFAVLRGPGDGWAVVMLTTWDSAGEASEFQQAAGRVVGEGQDPGTVIIDDRDVAVVIASDGQTLNEAVSAAGFVIPG